MSGGHEQGWFITSEVGPTVKRQTVVRFRKAKEDLLPLENEMASIGKSWIAFATAIQHPGEFSFRLEPEEIILSRRDGTDRPPVCRISRVDLDWEFLSRLIARYERIAKNTHELAAELRRAGVPI
ncbi:MAG: hypothetical protein ACJ74Z_08215 [Bryobacteraceae bacterium]